MMKKLNYFISALLLSIVLLGAGCSKKNADVISEADFYGSWKRLGIIMTINPNTLLRERDDVNKNYTLGNLTWTATANSSGSLTAEYPTGYKISGKCLSINDYKPNKVDGSPADVGDIVEYYFYISIDKKSLYLGHPFFFPLLEGPYIKQ